MLINQQDMEGNLVFQAISWHADDVQNDEYDEADDENNFESTCVIKAFGVTLSGETVGVSITSLKPYFFYKVSKQKWV